MRVLCKGGSLDGRTYTVDERVVSFTSDRGERYAPPMRSCAEQNGMVVWETREPNALPTMTPEQRERFELQR